MLSIFIGIIIDNFFILRYENLEKEQDMKGNCFICGLPKLRFDRAASDPSKGFKRHYKEDHNVWDYFAFVVFIYEQDKDDDDGLEAGEVLNPVRDVTSEGEIAAAAPAQPDKPPMRSKSITSLRPAAYNTAPPPSGERFTFQSPDAMPPRELS